VLHTKILHYIISYLFFLIKQLFCSPYSMINSQTEIERKPLFSKHQMSVSICRMNFQNIKNVFMVFSREYHKFWSLFSRKPQYNSDKDWGFGNIKIPWFTIQLSTTLNFFIDFCFAIYNFVSLNKSWYLHVTKTPVLIGIKMGFASEDGQKFASPYWFSLVISIIFYSLLASHG